MSDHEEESVHPPQLKSLPVLLSANPEDPNAEAEYEKWAMMAQRFLINLPATYTPEDRMAILSTGLSASNFMIVKRINDVDEALTALRSAFLKRRNLLIVREKLHTARQEPGEDIKTFFRRCLTLSQDCEYESVTAEENVLQNARDAFAVGLRNPIVKARVMENGLQTLDDTLNTAMIVSDAIRDSSGHISTASCVDSAAVKSAYQAKSSETQRYASRGHHQSSASSDRCRNCARTHSSGERCPAMGKTCAYCHKVGHFKAACFLRIRNESSRSSTLTSASISEVTEPNNENQGKNYIGITARCTGDLSMSTVSVKFNNITTNALLDSGCCGNIINEKFFLKIRDKLDIKPLTMQDTSVCMAYSSSVLKLNKYCICDITVQNNVYKNLEFMIMPSAIYDVLLGEPFFKLHESVKFCSNGKLPMLQIGLLSPMKPLSPVYPFANLEESLVPIAVRSRKYSELDREFIRSEVTRLLNNDVISPSSSPWRAQVLVANRGLKPRLVIDYSQTINRYTYPDAYPIPNIEALVNDIACNKYFSKIDLTSAYHQIPLAASDRKYTAFEADGKLYHFNRLSFGLTNGSACFQRAIDELVTNYSLNKCYPFMDDITIAGSTLQEHDKNLNAFLEIAAKHGLTINDQKSEYCKKTIKLLGYEISCNWVRPDPDRLQGLRDYKIPTNGKELDRLKGMLAYYAKWIKNYSEKIQCLTKVNLPLDNNAQKNVRALIDELSTVTLKRIDASQTFTVETDASYGAIAATLSQDSHPVAFFSRTLCSSERNHSSIEKEAYAIVESVRKWQHLLMGKHFTIITDQKSVSFMFDEQHSSNVKNDKIARWRIELMPYKFDILYRPGKLNVPADALTRQSNSSVENSQDCQKGKSVKVRHVGSIAHSLETLRKVHSDYGHPGVTRMWDLVKRMKLPYSLDEIRKLCSDCSVCAQLKPSFSKQARDTLISALRPLDRLSIDFKGPLPNSFGNNKFLFVAVDEYSRFPFAFPCKHIDSITVINCLEKIFSFCGTPKYVHSDRGTSFMSQSVKDFLFGKGIASSHSTPYHPTGNSQCEKYVGIIWKTITLNLKDKDLDMSKWDSVIDVSLGNIRSLMNTSTNESPHERFFSFDRRSFVQQNENNEVNRQRYMYLRKFVRGKTDPLVEQVEVINFNPKYSEIRYKDGREDKVSNNDLSSCPSPLIDEEPEDYCDPNMSRNVYYEHEQPNLTPPNNESLYTSCEFSPPAHMSPRRSPNGNWDHAPPPVASTPVSLNKPGDSDLRRSGRTCRLPRRFNDYVFD